MAILTEVHPSASRAALFVFTWPEVNGFLVFMFALRYA